MDIIMKLANRFVQQYLNPEHRLADDKEIIKEAIKQLDGVDNRLDKIRILNLILEGNAKAYNAHKLECNAADPDSCATNIAHESVAYFLIQELNRLEVYLNEDTFTVEEKISADSNLDKVMRNLEELKIGHQIIYDDLMKEIDELKALYFLGKKNWYQLLVGKCLEMVASGVISETISKQIITSVAPALTRLIKN